MVTGARDDLSKLEERFLKDLETTPIPIDSLLTALRFLKAANQPKLTESWAQMALGKLVDNGDKTGLIKLLALLAAWRDDVKTFGEICRTCLKKASQDRVWNACVDSVAFGEAAPLESLRRLQFLVACKPGSLCLDKTWGFGVVKRIDDFYKRMTVDFVLKPNHALSLANAGENLAFISDGHILAVRHRDPAAFERQIREQPAAIVRLALDSFGPVSVARLASLLEEHHLLPASDWKRFWDGARKALKADPLIELPAKRTEPIVVRETGMAFDRSWFEALRAERDISVIVRQIGTLEATGSIDALDDFAREALSDRLAFALKGAYNTDPARYARLALMVERLKLDQPPAAELCAHLLDQHRLLAAAAAISARESAGMVAFLLRHDTRTAALLLNAIPEMNYNLVSVSLDTLLEDPANLPAVQARCRELLAAPAVPHTLLVWTLRNLARVGDWPLPSLYELMGQSIAVIEDHTLTGERLRMQHQILGLFEQAKWFEAAFAALDPLQRAAIFARIYGNTSLGDATTQRALVGRMVKIDPELTSRKQAGGAASAPAAPATRWTSWRSLRERQALLRNLVDVEIPRNSAEIAHARSYGDLSENFEYHAAKQQQTILMSRRDEWDLELKQVRGTKFDQVDLSVVGIGVAVTFERANGETQTYSILGEWDSHEALNILPNRSRLARALEGARVGDTVTIPGTPGDEAVTIRAIAPLDETVRAWLDEPETSAAATPAPN